MTTKANDASPAPLTFKTILWRIAVSVLILVTLAGPGAQILHTLAR